MAEIVGGVSTGRAATTLSWKVVLAVALPSLTVTVMLATPLWPAAGVIVTVRLLLAPPKTMLLVGTTDGVSEAAERVRLDAAIAVSPIVKGIGGVAVP